MNRPELLNRLRVMGISLSVQAAIGYADYATGSELHLDVFYFIPIAICAWYLRRADVVVSAFAGALTWGYADIRGGHHYSRIAFWYWNILVCFSSLLIFGQAGEEKTSGGDDQRGRSDEDCLRARLFQAVQKIINQIARLAKEHSHLPVGGAIEAQHRRIVLN